MTGSQPSTEFGTATAASAYRFDCAVSQTLKTSISRTRKNVAVQEPKRGAGACALVYVLALADFRAKVRGIGYRQANDPATEVWRACQRSGSADGWRSGLLRAAD